MMIRIPFISNFKIDKNIAEAYKDFTDNANWGKPTEKQKNLLIENRFFDEGTVGRFSTFLAICGFLLCCFLWYGYIGKIVSDFDKVLDFIKDSFGTSLLIIFATILFAFITWGLFYIVYSEVFLKESKKYWESIQSGQFAVLNDINVCGYIEFHDPEYITSEAFIVEYNNKFLQFDASGYRKVDNSKYESNDILIEKAILVKAEIETGIFKKKTKCKTKLFFYPENNVS